MRVLITGGYGFIGAWIARNLLARGDHGLGLRPEGRPAPAAADPARSGGAQGRVRPRRRDRPPRASQGHRRPRHHAHHPPRGLQVPTCRADPMLGAKVNVLGTLAVFEAVQGGRAADQAARLRQLRRRVRRRRTSTRRGHCADDVLLVPSTHYGVFKCCNEGNARIYFQDHGISSDRAAAVDRLRRRPRPRHDQRADQGDQGGAARPAVPHQLRRLERLPVRR